ncbi:hypothetical protein D621_18105 [beta proteobacterium AAP51]|nr:hypothetical protein D621_18105 [beta proteobacterium AAP51]
MSKRKQTKRTISTEEAREAIQAKRYDLAGVLQLDAREVSKLLQQFESVDYLSLADFIRLFVDAERQMLEKVEDLESDYALGIAINVAKAVFMSLLRIMPVQKSVEDPPTDREQTEEEMETMRKSVRAAAKVAADVLRVQERTGDTPSLEELDRMIEKEAKAKGTDKELVRAQLETARDGDPPVTLGDNTQLPVVAQLPKSFHSGSKHQVITTVKGLIDPGTDVEVTVSSMMDGGDVPKALEGLINKAVKASFVPDRKGKVRRTLLSAQLTGKPLMMTVEVDRAFRASDWRHNTLTINKLHAKPELAAAVVEVSSQLQLDLGT